MSRNICQNKTKQKKCCRMLTSKRGIGAEWRPVWGWSSTEGQRPVCFGCKEKRLIFINGSVAEDSRKRPTKFSVFSRACAVVAAPRCRAQQFAVAFVFFMLFSSEWDCVGTVLVACGRKLQKDSASYVQKVRWCNSPGCVRRKTSAAQAVLLETALATCYDGCF